MFNNGQPPEVTDISGLQINKITEGFNTAEPLVESPTPPTPPVEKPVEPTPTPTPTLGTGASNTTPPPVVETPVSPTPQNTPTPEVPVIDPSSEHFKSFLSKSLPGIESLEQVNQNIARLKEVEANPAILLKNDQERKIFDYLSKFSGGDYGKGFQTFIKLQDMNVESLDSKSALKEVYMLENTKAGLSESQAERMFEFEYQEKYESKGEIGTDFEARDAYIAKQKLATLKQEALMPPVVVQDNIAEQQRAKYLSAVDESFQKAPIKEIKFKVSENPTEDYTFPVKDPASVHAAVSNIGEFLEKTYGDGKGNYKMDNLKADFAFLQNKDEIFQKLIEHGINIGIERKIKERTNTPSTPASNAPQGGAPVSLQDAILAGMKK